MLLQPEITLGLGLAGGANVDLRSVGMISGAAGQLDLSFLFFTATTTFTTPTVRSTTKF